MEQNDLHRQPSLFSTSSYSSEVVEEAENWETSVPKTVVESLSKEEIARQSLIFELIQGEQNYYNDLSFIETVSCSSNLTNDAKPDPSLTGIRATAEERIASHHSSRSTGPLPLHRSMQHRPDSQREQVIPRSSAHSTARTISGCSFDWRCCSRRCFSVGRRVSSIHEESAVRRDKVQEGEDLESSFLGISCGSYSSFERGTDTDSKC